MPDEYHPWVEWAGRLQPDITAGSWVDAAGKWGTQPMPPARRFNLKEIRMFEMHMLNDQGKNEMKQYKSELAKAVNAALELMPECREKALFKTRIEEAVFFGAKAIAGKQGNHDSVQNF